MSILSDMERLKRKIADGMAKKAAKDGNAKKHSDAKTRAVLPAGRKRRNKLKGL
jgi:hypothetical protein